MNQKAKYCLVLTVLSAGFFACQREAATELTIPSDGSLQGVATAQKPGGDAPGNSAAAHLAASEKLAIPPSVALPENLPAGNLRLATFFAVGVQKYKAREKAGSPGVYEWAFVAPQARLYDGANRFVGTHGAGPFWQLSPQDIVFGQQFSPARTAPGTDSESIDWLLLKPKDGTVATGIFTGVQYIQRIATKGGKAPLIPPASASDTVDVKYMAVYRFSTRKP